ncbi:hypothetical protein Vadar_027597 [Vaccinium darrowii]|uniref:Uncharacterized protein n=1 Tax=Vaccinium darrowii TaxID=229202 RepID=A0ACB7YGR1_9ERIC|nr:hypothetical protein Vadar_027597 [Vaccinium darrowii]
MALCNSKSPTHFRIQQSQPVLFLNFLRLTIFLFILFPFANSISFNFSNFNINDLFIYYQGDAFASNGVIQLTKNDENQSLTSSAGRATYFFPMYLWDSTTRYLTDFNTHFTFRIESTNIADIGDGLTFFLSPSDATLPFNSAGGLLGLFENSTALNIGSNQVVAIEFDTYKNSWDPSHYHVGIDINSIQSVAYRTVVLADNHTGSINVTANAWVNYDSSTFNLIVYLTFEENADFQGNYSLSYVVDLREVLPPLVSVGFSGATGLETTEMNNIVSWTFNSTLEMNTQIEMNTQMTHTRLAVGLAVGIGALSCGVGLFWFMKRKKIVFRGKNDMGLDASTDDDDFEKGKASKESDVYSFGVVALEIACGRKPVESNRNPGQVQLLKWVWSLYGKGQLFEAVDKNLTMEYDEYQVERLIVVGLWCCHPDVNLRPSIKQAINILSSKEPLPVLPSQMPVPV